MVCERKSCRETKPIRVKEISGNVVWMKYPSPEENGFGNGKFCYFISCPISQLPIRDYVYEKKLEPHYETMSYNEYFPCNQRGIKNALGRGISHIIFYTRYQGKIETYRNRYFIAGLFCISAWRNVGDRIAYRSDNPIFLSVDDSMELDDKLWQNWFAEDLPEDKRGAHNLRYMAKFVEKDSLAMQKIQKHFDEKKNFNKIDEYIKELTK